MRISVVNFCSTAVDMLDFSSKMLIKNAGTTNFDYVIITWNPTPEVGQWISTELPVFMLRESTYLGQTGLNVPTRQCKIDISWFHYHTKPKLAYVPNLRAMMSFGFDKGYEINDWVAIVNTDMAFGSNWLINLMKRANEDVIPNSLHLSPIKGPNIITANLGLPIMGKFDLDRFRQLHHDLYKPLVETEEDRGGWRACATLPYIVHKKWWEMCGPWKPNFTKGEKRPPDQCFFERCHDAGARFVLVHDSICYHHEAVERRSGRRPVGIENMPEGR